MPLFKKKAKEKPEGPFAPLKSASELLVEKFVVEDLRKEIKNVPTGIAAYWGPVEMETIFDFTGLRGSGAGIYFSLIYQLPKWDFVVKKLDEFIEVTPTWAEYYNITIAQKQKLEGAIKAGMASVAQAVADYELMQHDARRYKEIIDYFKAAKTDEHVLRSLFVDRVDAFTGEGYSLITMARRWPTIITDFIRMKEEWTDINEIKDKLDVSQAEATVLKTKNELFKEWKTLVLPSIKERYTRIQALCDARKRSIDEYKTWLKPYIATYRMIRERQESKPSETFQNPYYVPGFGQAQAFTGVRLWAFKTFHPVEPHRGEMVKMPGEWKLEQDKDTGKIKAKKKGGWVVFPYDDFVDEWRQKIEEHYGVEITVNDVKDIINDMAKAPHGGTNTNKMYWALFDIKVTISLVKTPPPAGFESDNLMFEPVKTYGMSQNVLLIHLIEMKAREKVFEKYIDEILGTRAKEEEIWKEVEKELEGKEEKKKRIEVAAEKFSATREKIHNFFYRILPYFIKVGHYEPLAKERLSKQYNRSLGPDFERISDYIMDKMQVE